MPLLYRERSWWQTAIQRGYAPFPPEIHFVPKLFSFSKRSGLRPSSTDTFRNLEGSREKVLFVFVTVLSRCSLQEHKESFRRFLGEISLARRQQPLDIYCGLALQVSPTAIDDGYARAVAMTESADIENDDRLTVALIPVGAKITSLNYYNEMAANSGYEALGWVDDDVSLDTGALSGILASFRLHGKRGAHGARKCPHPKNLASSKTLHFAKESMRTPATRYPHGCCMLISCKQFISGINTRYNCDDGFICFELMTPAQTNPLKDLFVVDGAVCHHYVGGTWSENYFRIRRSLLNVAIFCGDYSREKAVFYLRYIQFYGLWPLAPFDSSLGLGRGLRKWGLKMILFLWFCEIALELSIRGALKRPLRSVNWAAYEWWPGIHKH